MMNKSTKRFVRQGMGHERGFTLLEALIAFVVLAGGLLAAFRFHSITLTTTAESKVRAQATALAQQKIEDLRNFQTLDEFEAIVVDGSGLGDYGAVDYAAAFDLDWDRDEAFGDNPRKVDVTVSWVGRDGVVVDGKGTQSVMLSSIIWGNNPQDDAAGIALSLKHGGKPAIDYYEDGDGNPITPGGGGDGDKVIITEVTITETDEETGDETTVVVSYDIKFFGDIAFTDEGLESVGISGGPDESASCDIVNLVPIVDGDGDPVLDEDGNPTTEYQIVEGGAGGFLYRCIITGVPDDETWTGTLSYDPAGNDAVCSPGPTLDIAIDQDTTSLSLAVVVLTNNGACNQT